MRLAGGRPIAEPAGADSFAGLGSADCAVTTMNGCGSRECGRGGSRGGSRDPRPVAWNRQCGPWQFALFVACLQSCQWPVAAMSCFSEMNFGWCEFNRINPEEPPNCPNYTFSIASFQRKLDAHYLSGGRPPLMEAFFLNRLMNDYRAMLVEQDCPTPLVFAHFLVGELALIAPPWGDEGEGWREIERAVEMAKLASPFQQHLMVAVPSAWPFRKAMDQARRAQTLHAEAAERVQLGFRFQVDFVVAHCREDLDWLERKLGQVPVGTRLFIYEKCGRTTQSTSLPGASKFAQVVVTPKTDLGSTRGDECSAYLAHIVGRYDSLADFTIFLQSDPHEHLHFDFLDLVLRSMAATTYSMPFLPLNGPKHVRTLTPCLSAVHEELFGTNLTEILGPYCCAQFAVARETIRRHDRSFYENMLSLVDGTRNVDLCGVEGTKRSTQCYGYEFLWHVVFNEAVDPPSREDDPRLPVAFRLKHGREHVRMNWAGVPLARDIPIKVVPDEEQGNPLLE